MNLNFRNGESLGPRAMGDGAEAGSGLVAWKGEQTLEDFNVRVLYDKLEDQNLHLASQLARHNDDLQAFYDKINKQNDELKNMLTDFDVTRLEEIEKQRREASEANTASGSGSSINQTNVHLGGRQFKFAGKGC